MEKLKEVREKIQVILEDLANAQRGNMGNPDDYIEMCSINEAIDKLVVLFPPQQYSGEEEIEKILKPIINPVDIKDVIKALSNRLPAKQPDSGVLNADEVTLAFFRKYLEMPTGTLEELCREIIRLKSVKQVVDCPETFMGYSIDELKKICQFAKSRGFEILAKQEQESLCITCEKPCKGMLNCGTTCTEYKMKRELKYAGLGVVSLPPPSQEKEIEELEGEDEMRSMGMHAIKINQLVTELNLLRKQKERK